MRYQDVQRAEAEEIMSTGVHGFPNDAPKKDKNVSDASEQDAAQEQATDSKRRFEEKRHEAGLGQDDNLVSEDSIAKNAMLHDGQVSKEPWDQSKPEQEKVNFVQEELYIHAKLCIVDDKTVICGSSNINDRVRLLLSDAA